MNKNLVAGFVLVALGSTNFLSAAEMPPMPKPVKEHRWLQRLVGIWDTEAKIVMEPGKAPMKCKSTDRFQMEGGFWVVGKGSGEMMGERNTTMLTLGYDPAKQRFVGTWIDSHGSYMWKYTGALDGTGRVLTLKTEGPCPMRPGKVTQFKEVIHFKNDNNRTFSSSYQGDDGKWTTMFTAESRRRK